MPPATGVKVEFRNSDTKALLWTAMMNCIPRAGDKIRYQGNTVNVTEVGFIFHQIEETGEEPPSVTDCQHTPVVLVEVP